MTVAKARRIREKLRRLLDACEIYPRRNTFVDSVSLALFQRMCELHESLCLLASIGRYRDAVVLGRTLCEAAISHYWLTNKDTDVRFDRYVYFAGQVRLENIGRVQEHYGQRHIPSDPTQLFVMNQAAKLFKKSLQWNDKNISEMASEPDAYEKRKDGSAPDLSPQYRLFYWWFSLLAHPSIEAVQNFLPGDSEAFRVDKKPSPDKTIPEEYVVFLSTVWLFLIASRIDTVMDLEKGKELRRIFSNIKRKN